MRNFVFNYKNPIGVVAFIILAGGIFAFGKFKTSLFPEITFPKIKVIADAGQLPVDKMMLTVTRPLENAIKQVPDLKLLRSTTSRGSCEISAFMDWKADINVSQQRIEARINQILGTLPPGVKTTVEKMNPSILPVIGYTLVSKSLSPVDLKKLALYTIKPFLSQVDGVSEVRVIGGKTKEYWIVLNNRRMSALGITPDKINTTLSQTNFVSSNGYISDYRYLYLTVTDAIVDSKEELEKLVISNDGKRITTLKDIATIELQEAKEYIKVNANGRDAILLAIIKQPNANLLDLTLQMEAKVVDLKKILSKDVSVEPFYIQAEFVNNSVKSVTDSLWVGLGLAILVAIVFLRSMKASLTILITIPVTLLLTIIVLYATGQTLNIMTLGAIAAAIGLIIDDSIVVVEQIHRAQEEFPERPAKEVVLESMQYLFPAMVGSSLSTIVIFVPFVLMSGVAGAYFKVMTDTMIIALVSSFFVTWIILPVIYLFTHRNHSGKKEHPVHHTVKNQGWVRYFVNKPYLSAAFLLLLAFSIYWVFPKLQTGFLPNMDEGSIVLDYSSPPGASLDETDRILREVEKIIVTIPEVQAYSRRTGTQMGFFITEPNRGDYLIQLKKNRKRSTDQVIAEIRQRIEVTQPALRIDFGQVIGDMLGDLMSSVQPVEVKVFGSDQKKLQELSRQVAKAVSSVPGTADVFDGIVIAGPSVTVEPDINSLAFFGLSPANLQFQLQSALEGNIAGSFYDKDQLSAIRIVYPGNITLSVAELKNIQIFLPNGTLKPIQQLARITVNEGEAEITRENLQSMSVVTARLDQRDLGSVIKEIQGKISKEIKFPPGFGIAYGGSFADQQQSFKELLMILITASLLVFGVILFLYREFLVALTILVVSVFGIAGSYLALYITHTPLNVGSYTGLIMIVGIIGENSIFTLLQFRESFRTQTAEEAIIYSISTRLRPKLMTAIGAIAALMPIALGIGTGAQLHQPLAIAVIGGFMAALPLLLIVLPTILLFLYKNRSKE